MRVIERNKKGRKYYYIQHSFRKGGKIITRERYLGKIIPENVEKIMQDMKKESEKDLYANLEKIRKNFQKEWKGLPESAKEREKEEIAIAFTYNTNAIEGSAITLGETREIIHDKTAPKKPLRDIKETEAHSKVFFDMLNSKEKISASLMLKWHKDVFGETKPDIAGKSRTYLVRVGDYIASDWQDIGAVMKELVRFIRSSDANAVELAARVHYRFEKIHPFGDGNGRIGRLLMNCILWQSGYPMLVIEYRNRKSYYMALKRDESGFVKYFLGRYMSVHRKRYA